MRRTEVSVFLVAMAILPFLQNMFLNIGTGHYIHVCMYTVYLQCKNKHVYMNFRQNFSQKNTFAISEKTLAKTVCSLHTQRLTQRKPLSWTFCSTLIYITCKAYHQSNLTDLYPITICDVHILFLWNFHV